MIHAVDIFLGDSREVLSKFPDGYFNLIMTSPPYADARKNHYDSIHPDNFVNFFLTFHEEFWRVLADDGSFILNIKDKVIEGQRHRYVWKTIMELTEKGWLCIDDYIWHKPNAMPGYWPNRLRDEWEYCFHLTKKKKLSKLNGKSTIRHNSENNSGFGRDLNKWVDKDFVLPGNVVSVPLIGKN